MGDELSILALLARSKERTRGASRYRADECVVHANGSLVSWFVCLALPMLAAITAQPGRHYADGSSSCILAEIRRAQVPFVVGRLPANGRARRIRRALWCAVWRESTTISF